MASTTHYDGAAGAATLHPLERLFAAAIHEHEQSQAKRRLCCGPLSRARACIHALARFLIRDGKPSEISDHYAADLAARTLIGRAWFNFKKLEAAGMGAHEALHLAIGIAEPDPPRDRDETTSATPEAKPVAGEMAARCIDEALEHLRKLHETLVNEASRAHLLATSGHQFEDERRQLRSAIHLFEAIRRCGYEVKP
jgi:hypothetical protein